MFLSTKVITGNRLHSLVKANDYHYGYEAQTVNDSVSPYRHISAVGYKLFVEYNYNKTGTYMKQEGSQTN